MGACLVPPDGAGVVVGIDLSYIKGHVSSRGMINVACMWRYECVSCVQHWSGVRTPVRAPGGSSIGLGCSLKYLVQHWPGVLPEIPE